MSCSSSLVPGRPTSSLLIGSSFQPPGAPCIFLRARTRWALLFVTKVRDLFYIVAATGIPAVSAPSVSICNVHHRQLDESDSESLALLGHYCRCYEPACDLVTGLLHYKVATNMLGKGKSLHHLTRRPISRELHVWKLSGPFS